MTNFTWVKKLHFYIWVNLPSQIDLTIRHIFVLIYSDYDCFLLPKMTSQLRLRHSSCPIPDTQVLHHIFLTDCTRQHRSLVTCERKEIQFTVSVFSQDGLRNTGTTRYQANRETTVERGNAPPSTTFSVTHNIFCSLELFSFAHKWRCTRILWPTCIGLCSN